MRAYHIAINYIHKPYFFHMTNGPPKRGFATPWLLRNGGLLRVDLTVVGPEAEQAQRDLSLSDGEAERILKAISDVVILFNK